MTSPLGIEAWPLWYGWSPVGPAGPNCEQLVACSSRLRERPKLMDAVRPWLRFQPGDAVGFAQVDGYGLAFRRTDNGLDNAGRSGAFFTHALVFPAGLPVDRLRQAYALLDRTEPPQRHADLPSELADLVLAGAPDSWRVEPDDHALVGTLLSQLAAGSAVEARWPGEEDAWRIVSLVVRAVPEPLPACTVSAQLPAVRRAGTIAIAIDPEGRESTGDDAAWQLAASLVLEAPDDLVAARVLEVLRGLDPDCRRFCQLLGAWASLERTARAGLPLPGRDRAFLEQDAEARLPLLAARGGGLAAFELATVGTAAYAAVIEAGPAELRRRDVERRVVGRPLEQQLDLIDESELAPEVRNDLSARSLGAASDEALAALPAPRKRSELLRVGGEASGTLRERLIANAGEWAAPALHDASLPRELRGALLATHPEQVPDTAWWSAISHRERVGELMAWCDEHPQVDNALRAALSRPPWSPDVVRRALAALGAGKHAIPVEIDRQLVQAYLDEITAAADDLPLPVAGDELRACLRRLAERSPLLLPADGRPSLPDPSVLLALHDAHHALTRSSPGPLTSTVRDALVAVAAGEELAPAPALLAAEVSAAMLARLDAETTALEQLAEQALQLAPRAWGSRVRRRATTTRYGPKEADVPRSRAGDLRRFVTRTFQRDREAGEHDGR